LKKVEISSLCNAQQHEQAEFSRNFKKIAVRPLMPSETLKALAEGGCITVRDVKG
jgi:hypothetical protein